MDQGFKGDRVLGSGEGTGETKIHHRTSFFFNFTVIKITLQPYEECQCNTDFSIKGHSQIFTHIECNA